MLPPRKEPVADYAYANPPYDHRPIALTPETACREVIAASRFHGLPQMAGICTLRCSWFSMDQLK
jgi:hypothetical protein